MRRPLPGSVVSTNPLNTTVPKWPAVSAWNSSRNVLVPTAGTPRCGNCHRPLPWIVDAGDDTFTDTAEKASVPVLVDLWAPCRMVRPALAEVATEMPGQIKLVKVNVDSHPGCSSVSACSRSRLSCCCAKGRRVRDRRCTGSRPAGLGGPGAGHLTAGDDGLGQPVPLTLAVLPPAGTAPRTSGEPGHAGLRWRAAARLTRPACQPRPAVHRPQRADARVGCPACPRCRGSQQRVASSVMIPS